jgi:hypothetical protein
VKKGLSGALLFAAAFQMMVGLAEAASCGNAGDGSADALASTANFLKDHGWIRGEGYQPSEPNFSAIQDGMLPASIRALSP